MGGVGPFTEHVVRVPVGQLTEPLFLEALYRMEVAVAVAWALGLVPSVPPPEIPADCEALSPLFPMEGSPAPSIRNAKLREPSEIANKLAEWTALATSARGQRDSSPGEAAAIRYSRAFERVRGLAWVSGDLAWIEDTVMDV